MNTNNINSIIFTIADNIANDALFIQLLKRDSINCVIDIRLHNNANCQICNSNIVDDTKKSFIELLSTNKIIYVDFSSIITQICTKFVNKKDEYDYNKISSNNDFINLMQRIINGINKKYRIAILDTNTSITKSIRFNVIGRYLSVSGYNVVHLQSNGRRILHEDLVKRIEDIKIKRINKQKNNIILGQKGELIAGMYLMKNGFRIIEKNWNLHKGCEIDIIAYKNNKLHFIEVKTRTSDKYGAPQQAINYKKLRNIGKAIQEYKFLNKIYNTEHQIDSIAIIYNSDDDYQLNYYEDIGLKLIPKFY